MPEQLKKNQAVKVQEAERKQKPRATGGSKCPYCGASIDPSCEICPQCGSKLVSYCTFCGTDLLPGETVCPECGMPTAGVKCPVCGTINHRSFCRKCNQPLTKAAIRAVEKAKVDPVFIKCTELSQKTAELEAELAEATGKANPENREDTPEKAELSEGAKQMMELLGKAKNVSQKSPAKQNGRTIEQIKDDYNKTVKDLNQLLAEMLPPAGSTPQEQRNYYSARKVAVRTKTIEKIKLGWICNYCGCLHNCPSECAEPWHGGHWEYKEVETETLEYKLDE